MIKRVKVLLSVSLCVLIVTVSMLPKLSFGIDMDYYIDISAITSKVSVDLNGFPMLDVATGSRSRSKWVTPYLINGTNSISISYVRTGESDDNSGVTCAITAVPHGTARGGAESSVFECSAGSQVSWITQFTTNQFEVLYGELSTNGIMTFVTGTNSVRKWGGVLSDGNQFETLPSRVDYVGLNSVFTNVSLLFSQATTDVQVVFGGFDMTNAIGSLELSVEKITNGVEWINETGFNSLIIQGYSQHETNTSISTVGVFETDGDALSFADTFVLSIPQQWTWTQGDVLSSVNANDKALIWSEVESVHDALTSKDWDTFKALFTNKVVDIAGAFYTTFDVMESNQLNFFTNLVSDAGWPGLKALPVDGFNCVIIGDKVVKVETLDGGNVIVSESMSATNAPTSDYKFELPLYLSRVSGDWVISQ